MAGLLLFLFGVLLLLSGCGDGGGAVGETGASPGSGNTLYRVFVKPFAGDYPNSWPFDHDLPLGRFDNTRPDAGNSDVLTWKGELVVEGWGDGKYHNGHDWVMPEGTPLFAVAAGEIFFAGRE